MKRGVSIAVGVLFAGSVAAADYTGPYLESTGTGPYVDLGVKGVPDTKIDYWFDLQKDAYPSSGYCLMGAMKDYNNRFFVFYVDANGLMFANKGESCSDNTPSPRGWYHAVIENGASARACTIDGVNFKSVPGTPPTLEQNLYVFAHSQPGGINGKCHGGTRIGVVKIWQGGELVRVLIPSKNGSNVSGFDDLVSGTFIQRQSINAYDLILNTASGFRVAANRFVGTPSPDYGFAAASVGDAVRFTSPASVTGADSTVYYCHGWSLQKGETTLDSGKGRDVTMTVTAENNNATFVWNYSTEPIVLHGVIVECSDGISNPPAGFHEMAVNATETFCGPSQVITNKSAGLIKSCSGWRLVTTNAVETSGSGTSVSITCDSAHDGATLIWEFDSVPHVFTCDYTVVSTYGTPDPAAGAHTCNYGSTIDFRASAPVTNRPDHVRYVCTGWTLSVPGQTDVSGEELEKSVSIDDSNDGLTLTWNFATEALVYGVTVEGAYSTIEGGYGYKPITYGESVTFVAPIAVTNRADHLAAECTGWKLRMRDGTVTEGSDLTKTITVDDTTDGAKLTWRFKIVEVDISAYTHYVVPKGTAGNVPSAPYRSWATAANEITDALGYCLDDELVAIAPGVYSITNRIVINRDGVTVFAQDLDGSDASGRVVLDPGHPLRQNGVFTLAAPRITLRGLVFRAQESVPAPVPVADPWAEPVPVVPTRDPKAARVMNGSWLALGDSITYFNDNLATGQAAIKNGHSLTKGYQTRVKETLTFTSYANWSINGGKVSGLLTKNYTSFDYVTIAIGVNDCGGKTPMGDFSDFTNATQRASANTFYGQYGRLIDKIRAANANVKIILCTPRHAYSFYNQGAYWLPPRSHVPTSIGCSLEDYAKAVRRMARYENLPCCDFFAFCGDDAVTGRESIDVALHPDDDGYARMTEELLKVFATVE